MDIILHQIATLQAQLDEAVQSNDEERAEELESELHRAFYRRDTQPELQLRKAMLAWFDANSNVDFMVQRVANAVLEAAGAEHALAVAWTLDDEVESDKRRSRGKGR